MKIAILGSKGFIGTRLVNQLNQFHNVIAIDKDNYQEHIGESYDVFINANGNSRRYLAEKDPKWDFEMNCVSTQKTLFDFKFNKYIYLSSLDASNQDSIYGIHKDLAEEMLFSYKQKLSYNLTIIRLGMVEGKGKTKGIVYDILNGKELSLSKRTTVQIISVGAVVEFVERILGVSGRYLKFNLAGTTSITIETIEQIIGTNAVIGTTPKEVQYNNFNMDRALVYYPLKTSEEYLEEVLSE